MGGMTDPATAAVPPHDCYDHVETIGADGAAWVCIVCNQTLEGWPDGSACGVTA